jgi:hypothetical protein
MFGAVAAGQISTSLPACTCVHRVHDVQRRPLVGQRSLPDRRREHIRPKQTCQFFRRYSSLRSHATNHAPAIHDELMPSSGHQLSVIISYPVLRFKPQSIHPMNLSPPPCLFGAMFSRTKTKPVEPKQNASGLWQCQVITPSAFRSLCGRIWRLLQPAWGRPAQS